MVCVCFKTRCDTFCSGGFRQRRCGYCDSFGIASAKRHASRKRRLKWRSWKRSLGWIPFKMRFLKLDADSISYLKRHYRLPRWRGLLALFRPDAHWSPALAEWEHLRWAREQGMPVPRRHPA